MERIGPIRLSRRLATVLGLAILGYGLLFVSIVSKGVFFNMVTQLDNALYGQFLASRIRLSAGDPLKPCDVVIAGIDDRSLKTLGAYNPEVYRMYHVAALRYLLSGNPRAVVYDILFADPHPDPAVDRALGEAMRKGRVFASHFAASEDYAGAIFDKGAYPNLAPVAGRCVREGGFFPMVGPVYSALSGFGIANAYADTDGVLRKLPAVFNVNGKVFPTVAIEVYRSLNGVPREAVRYTGGELHVGSRAIPVDADMRTRIPLIEDEYRIRQVSFSDLVRQRVPAEYFRDKVVFVAATATGLGDNKLVPVYGYIPGVKIHANLFLALEKNRMVDEFTQRTYYILLALASLFYTFIFYNKRPGDGFFTRIAKKAGRRVVPLWLEKGFNLRFRRFQAALDRFAPYYSWLRKSYVLRFSVILFQRTRSRVQTLLFQLLVLYVALFLSFQYGDFFVKPTALMIQVLLAYIIAGEFKDVETALAREAAP